jgi:hypothetical protein
VKCFSRLALFARTVLFLFAICTLECAGLLAQSARHYRDPKLGVEQRVADLLSRTTLEEKVAQLQGTWVVGGRGQIS